MDAKGSSQSNDSFLVVSRKQQRVSRSAVSRLKSQKESTIPSTPSSLEHNNPQRGGAS